jgi:glycosyltransferase involved in cell wall biosynthesis
MNGSEPRVSVIVPNYNYARFLRKRLRTVLDQTYDDVEIIYLDDCSTDDSNEIIAEFKDDPRIRCVFNERNSGSPFIQINKGVRLARGEFVWVAEADDYADPRFLDTLLPILANNPNVGVAYCQSLAIDEQDKVLSSMQKHTDYLDEERWKRDFMAEGETECRKYLLYSNTIPNFSAVLFRRSVFERAGYAEEGMRLCGDWLTWIKMLMISDVAFVAEPLNFYRWHAGTVRRTLNYVRNVRERYELFHYLRQHTDISDFEFDIVYSKLLKEWSHRIRRSKWRDSIWDIPSVVRIAADADPRFAKRFGWHMADKMSFGLTKRLRRKLGIEILAKRPRSDVTLAPQQKH